MACGPISIHALLAESDRRTKNNCIDYSEFLSTLSLRRATPPWGCTRVILIIFLSTLSLRRATSKPRRLKSRRCVISIHALLAESDVATLGAAPPAPISIHALLAESDLSLAYPDMIICTFLSTLSLRRATLYVITVPSNNAFLSTLSLRRATNQQPDGTTSTTYFYPRSPCGERRNESSEDTNNGRFLSTLSLRRATSFCYAGDCATTYFYPRSPCGERPDPFRLVSQGRGFLSTLSLRRATSPYFGASTSSSVFLSTLSLRRATLNSS